MQGNFKSVQYQFDQGYYQEICTVTKEVSSFIIFYVQIFGQTVVRIQKNNLTKKYKVLENYLVLLLNQTKQINFEIL
jgi:hypothetical protein